MSIFSPTKIFRFNLEFFFLIFIFLKNIFLGCFDKTFVDELKNG